VWSRASGGEEGSWTDNISVNEAAIEFIGCFVVEVVLLLGVCHMGVRNVMMGLRVVLSATPVGGFVIGVVVVRSEFLGLRRWDVARLKLDNFRIEVGNGGRYFRFEACKGLK
jgi:hypothetical protein